MKQMDLARLLSGFTRLQTLDANESGKDYFVGDLAGQFSLLQRAMHKADFNPQQDRLFCTGNLIDHGQESLEVLELLSENWFYPVLGLHELMMLDALQRGHYLNWYVAGGHWAFDEDIRLKWDLGKACKALAKLPIAMIVRQKKHSPIGLVSRYPLDDFSQQGFELASLRELLDCLLNPSVPHRKGRRYDQFDCIVTGGEPASKIWSKGNVVGINLGGALLPKHGSLALFKRKKLHKAIDKSMQFHALNKD
ncbi:hypothetical protein GCM10009092_26240 [Bowmanella denitrificans]|uniref:Calcineurin-like phosphoesterase domain-containing protein n=1 Tax=Bowmanella denitrificans TaxID=366582 RepID=A0ABN0XCK4_9ALTE|nr:metallophosphoesterase [Bowmanella denitrificans]